MSGTQANHLTNPAVDANGQLNNNLIERFTGMVHGAMLKKESFINDFDVEDVVGTNQVTSKSVGDTEIQALVAGQEPEATSTAVANHSLVVDTVLIARNTIALLHQFQSDIKMQARIASSHTKKLIQLQDETLLSQVIRGALATDGRVSGHFGGNAVTLTAKGDEKDPVKYLKALETLVLMMNEKEVENEELLFRVPWEQYYVLMDNDKLTNHLYTAPNGNKVEGVIVKAYGFQIKPTNRIRQKAHAAGTHHFLSNENNGYRYDTTDGSNSTPKMVNCVGVLYGRSALLVGRTMGLSADIFFSKRLKTSFIDTWQSFGAIADEFAYCGAIFAADGYVPRKKFVEANDPKLFK